MIINGTNLVLGRMAAIVAKKIMLGEKVDIVNCENLILSGDKFKIVTRYKKIRDAGKNLPTKGPFLPRMPDRFVRRVIRGMIPRRKPKGRDAFKCLMCYIGVPDEFKDKKIETLEAASVSRLNTLKYTDVKTVCKLLGGRVQ